MGTQQFFDKNETIEVFVRLLQKKNDTSKFNPYSVTTYWQKVFYCLRCGMYEEIIFLDTCLPGTKKEQLKIYITDWFRHGGQLSVNVAREIDSYVESFLLKSTPRSKTHRLFKFAVLLILLGNKEKHQNFISVYPDFFSTLEDCLWFKLTCMHENILSYNYNKSYSLSEFQQIIDYFEYEKYYNEKFNIFNYLNTHIISQNFQNAIFYLFSNEDFTSTLAGVHLVLGLSIDKFFLMDSNKKLTFTNTIFKNASIILLLYIESIQIKREYVNTFIDYCILALWLEKSEKK